MPQGGTAGTLDNEIGVFVRWSFETRTSQLPVSKERSSRGNACVVRFYLPGRPCCFPQREWRGSVSEIVIRMGVGCPCCLLCFCEGIAKALVSVRQANGQTPCLFCFQAHSKTKLNTAESGKSIGTQKKLGQ